MYRFVRTYGFLSRTGHSKTPAVSRPGSGSDTLQVQVQLPRKASDSIASEAAENRGLPGTARASVTRHGLGARECREGASTTFQRAVVGGKADADDASLTSGGVMTVHLPVNVALVGAMIADRRPYPSCNADGIDALLLPAGARLPDGLLPSAKRTRELLYTVLERRLEIYPTNLQEDLQIIRRGFQEKRGLGDAPGKELPTTGDTAHRAWVMACTMIRAAEKVALLLAIRECRGGTSDQ